MNCLPKILLDHLWSDLRQTQSGKLWKNTNTFLCALWQMSSRSESLMGLFSGTDINTFNCLQCRLERSMIRQKWPAVTPAKTSAALTHFATRPWRVELHVLICRPGCDSDSGLQLGLQENMMSTVRRFLSSLLTFYTLITVGCGVGHSLVDVRLAPLAVASLISAVLLYRALSLVTALWSEVSKKTLAVCLFLMQMSSQACFSHLLPGSLKLYIGMIETSFRVDSLAFNGLHSSVTVESDAERYCIKTAGEAEVTEFFLQRDYYIMRSWLIIEWSVGERKTGSKVI